MSGMEPLMIMSLMASATAAGTTAAGTIASGNAQKSSAITQARQGQELATAQNKYAIEQAKMNRRAARSVAEQQRQRGDTELSSAQRKAEDLRLKRNLAVSKMIAQGAGSGFAPGAGDLAFREDDLFRYGTRQASLATGEGLQVQQDYDFAAANTLYDAESGLWAARREGALRSSAASSGVANARGISLTPSYLSAAGTIAAGAGEGFEKYKRG